MHPAWWLSAATAISLPAVVAEIYSSAVDTQFAVSRAAYTAWTVIVLFVTVVSAAIKAGWTAAQAFEAIAVRIKPKQPGLRYGFRTQPPYSPFEHATLKFGAEAEVTNDSLHRTDVQIVLASITVGGNELPDVLLRQAKVMSNATDWVGGPLERLALEPERRARVVVNVEVPVVEQGFDQIARLGSFVHSDVVAVLRFAPVRGTPTDCEVHIDTARLQDELETFFTNKLSHTGTNREDPSVLIHMRDEFTGWASEADRPG